jgi:pimeloyl-ACP methyl ester carboxylesterase
MDYAWALVPAETTDFNFMKDWGVVKDSQHTEIALWLARWIRGSTGQGFDQLHLLGFSYGGIIGYSVAGHETQQPDFLRNVKGIIVGDVAMKFEEKSISDYYCNAAAADQGNLNAGVYNDDTGVFLKQLSDLALSAPDDPSPIFAGLTNYQASLFLGTSTWLLDGNPIFWHFVAGAGELFADPFWIPSDLQYTKVRLWVDLLRAIPPHLPVQSDFDVHAEFCGTLEVPFDNHLRQIAVPILYVGAAGGFGRTGYYTTTLTASRDITRFTVQFLPDDRRALDFGHADLFTATNAETLVWKPILDWIVAHR